MTLRAIAALLAAAALVCTSASAKPARSHSAKAEFMRQHPCPATNNRRGSCPGWVVDHVIALACGGADHPSNMQWQSIADAKDKDKWERKGCR